MSLKNELQVFLDAILFPEKEMTDAAAGIIPRGTNPNRNILYCQDLHFRKLCVTVKTAFPRLFQHLTEKEIDSYTIAYFRKYNQIDPQLMTSIEYFISFLKSKKALNKVPWVYELMKFEERWQQCRCGAIEYAPMNAETIERFWKAEIRLRILDQSFLMESYWDLNKFDQKNFRSSKRSHKKVYFIRNFEGRIRLDTVTKSKYLLMIKALRTPKTWPEVRRLLKKNSISEPYFFKFMNDGIAGDWLVFDDEDWSV